MNTKNSSVIGQRYFYSDSGRRNVDCLARRAHRFINDSPKLTIPSPNFFKANWVTVFRSFILDIYNIQYRHDFAIFRLNLEIGEGIAKLKEELDESSLPEL